MANTLEKEVIKEICATGDKTSSIPATTETGSNSLSYADGFPIATAMPQSDGGIPPKRTDMNKVLNMLSKNQVFLQNGGSYSFDSNVASAIGGYPAGAILRYYDVVGRSYLIKSLVDNNTTAPERTNIKYKQTDTDKLWECIERVVIETQAPTQSTGYTWYRLWSDGWVEQGGITEGGSSGTYPVSFPIIMADTNYNISITPVNTSGASGQTNNYIKELSTNGMKIVLGQPINSCRWKIEGYAQ